MATITKKLIGTSDSSYSNKYEISLDYYEIDPVTSSSQYNYDYIEENKTNVYLCGKIYSVNQYYGYHGYKNTGKLKIDGSQVKSGENNNNVDVYDGTSNNKVTVVTGIFPVKHNDDGTKTITIRFDFSTTYSKINDGYIETTLELTEIPRASAVSVSDNPTLGGEAVTITCDRASTDFTHTIKIKNDTTVIESFTDVETTKSWAPSLATYASLITDSATKKFTIECITYNGTTNLGTSTADVTLTVPEDSNTKPVIDSITLAEGRIATQAGHDGVPSNWGCYVQNQSKINLTLNGTMKYGATLKGASTDIDGKTITGSLTELLETAGNNLPVSSVVTDSRGFTSSTKTATYNVVAYAPPQITKYTAERCNSSGTPTDDGTYLLYTFVGSISPVNNKNAKLFRIGYKEKNSYSDYTYVTVVNNAYTVNKSTAEILPGVTLDPSKAYDIIFEAQDYFYYSEPISKQAVIAIGADLLNFASNGKSVAIGQLSTATGHEKKFEVGMDTYINGALYINGVKMIWYE